MCSMELNSTQLQMQEMALDTLGNPEPWRHTPQYTFYNEDKAEYNVNMKLRPVWVYRSDINMIRPTVEYWTRVFDKESKSSTQIADFSKIHQKAKEMKMELEFAPPKYWRAAGDYVRLIPIPYRTPKSTTGMIFPVWYMQ